MRSELSMLARILLLVLGGSLSLFAQLPVDRFSQRLAAEGPVATPVGIPAPWYQVYPSAASDGRDFLVAWADHRLQPSGIENIFAARVSGTGAVLDPNGIPLGIAHHEFTRPEVVWLGSEYLVVWSGERERTMAMRIRPDGSLRDAEPFALLPGELRHAWFTSDGERSLVLSTDPVGRLQATVFDQHLSIRGGPRVVSPGGEVVRAGATGDVFMVVMARAVQPPECVPLAYGPCLGVRVKRLSREGVPLGDSEVTLVPHPHVNLDLASDGGSHFLLAYSSHESRPLRIHRITADGSIQPAVGVAAPRPGRSSTYVDPPSVSWTGADFAVAWAVPAETGNVIWLTRLRAQSGDPDPPRLISSVGFATASPELVSDAAGKVLAVWQRGTITQLPFWDLAAAILPDPEFLLTRSAVPQDRQAIASNGTVRMAVWTDVGGPNETSVLRVGRISSSGVPLDGPGLPVDGVPVSPAVIGSDGESFLIIWSRAGRLFTRRIDASGGWIDPEPRTTSLQTGGCITTLSQQALIWNGESYFLVRCASGRVIGVHLDRTGEPIGNEIEISSPGDVTENPVVATSGAEYLVVWTHLENPCFHHSCSPRDNMRAARVRRDGTVVDMPALRLSTSGTAVGRPAIAWGDRVYLVTWSASDGIRGTRIAADGTMLDGSPATDRVLIVETPRNVTSAVAWDRANFLVLWRQRITERLNALMALSLAPDHPLHGAPRQFGIVSEEYAGGSAAPSYGSPTAILVREGVLVAYPRVAPEAEYGGVMRIFARVIRSEGGRRRAVR